MLISKGLNMDNNLTDIEKVEIISQYLTHIYKNNSENTHISDLAAIAKDLIIRLEKNLNDTKN